MNEMKTKRQYEEAQEEFKSDRLSIPTLKYFWQVSPLSGSKITTIPKFLRKIKVFQNFTDFELKIFSGFIHQRKFTNEEIIIKEGDTGFGFYIIFDGQIEIYTAKNRIIDGNQEGEQQFIARLGKSEYFGELSLLENQNKRNASAVSKGNSQLLAIYKPDLEEMIERYPVLGAKFLQSVSLIVAMRFNRVTSEIKILKEKLADMERELDSKES